jgi:solute carrier family 45 protein 1/2/4
MVLSRYHTLDFVSAYLAWFPVLFYTTVYIGELHKHNSPPPEDDAAALSLEADATRLGTRALLYSALLSLAANIVLPFFVFETKRKPITVISPVVVKRTWLEYVRVHLVSLWVASHALFALSMFGTL